MGISVLNGRRDVVMIIPTPIIADRNISLMCMACPQQAMSSLQYRHQTAEISNQTPMPIMTRFSVSDTKPSGTLLSPPTQAHFNSR